MRYTTLPAFEYSATRQESSSIIIIEHENNIIQDPSRRKLNIMGRIDVGCEDGGPV